MKNISIVKFGSQLHNGYDQYSDRDLLVVTDKLEDLKELYNKYSSQGWSVSAYTYSKLAYLSRIGSLFIDHLRICSVTLTDSEDKFKEILRSHQTRTDFENDINGAVSYFDILFRIPDCDLGYAWFCDCMYVGIRNFLVFKCAKEGALEFSFLRLIHGLFNAGEIDIQEFHILKELRRVKYNYREDMLNKLPGKQFVQSVISIGKKLNLIASSIIVSPSEFSSEFRTQIISNSFNGYQRLRMVEGLYCSNGRNMPEIKMIVSNPQFYASKLLDANYLCGLITRIEVRDDNELIKILLSGFES
jgi:hypothetical protein